MAGIPLQSEKPLCQRGTSDGPKSLLSLTVCLPEGKTKLA